MSENKKGSNMLNSVNTHLYQNFTDTRIETPPATVVSLSVPWPETNLLDFLRLGNNAPRVYWESSQTLVQFAGFGVAARLTAAGPGRFNAIQQQSDRLFSRLVPLSNDIPADVGPRLFGGFAFNADDQPAGLWSAFPAAAFVLPQVQLCRVNGQSWLTVNRQIFSPAELAEAVRSLPREVDRLRAELDAASNNKAAEATHNPQLLAANLMAQETWHRLVSEATRRIRRGELDKVVLARARQMSFARPVDPAAVLTRLARRYPDTYRFLFEPIPGHAFYGATPELLARVRGKTLRTVAMAGSIARGDTPQADAELGRQLLNNPKEQHEHALVVDAIRENLQHSVTDLQIPAEPGLCKLNNIQHLQTKIKGTLAENRGVLPVIQGLHPTPAVGGRPRGIALDIIHHVEPTPRGWYAAPIGWLDRQGNGTFAVAIRSAVSVGSESMLFAGAGIVADSVPEKEWRETELKFRPLANALAGEGVNGRAQS